MKKVFVVAIAITMLLSISAFADGMNVEKMSLEELISLRETIDSEIQTRLGFSDDIIGSGYYVVGEDIKAGKYELQCVLAQNGEDPYEQCHLAIGDSADDDAETLFEYSNVQVGQQVMIELKDKNVLAIVRGNFLIQPYKHSWQP